MIPRKREQDDFGALEAFAWGSAGGVTAFPGIPGWLIGQFCGFDASTAFLFTIVAGILVGIWLTVLAVLNGPAR